MCASQPRLTLDEKIGQLFVPGAHGTFMAESSAAYQQLVHQVRDDHVGGVIWFVSNVYETALLTERLQAQTRVPLLISADLESGIGMRFLDTTFWPSAMAIAATGDPAFAEKEGQVVAREAKAIGINHILAPVADVNVDPDNPVINTRSYGEDPHEVGRFVAAFIRGVQSEHVLACAKHFPGHGDTHTDSHRSLPILDVTRERLDRVELVPFREAIAAGVKSVMIGHLSLPSIEPTPAPVRQVMPPNENPYGTRPEEVPHDGTIPATISPRIVDGLLRHDLQFPGLIVSDAFDMGGLTEHFEAGEAAVRAIEAGEDQVLMSPDVDAAIAAVRAAVKSGRISEARIDESVHRILNAKAFTGTTRPDIDHIFRTIDSPQHRELAAEIAERALTLVRRQSGVLPLRGDARVLLLMVTDFAEAPNPLVDLEKEVRARLAAAPVVIKIDPRSPAPEMPADIDVAIVALAVRARSGAGQIAVPAAARDFVRALNVPVVAMSFGSPYLLREVPIAGTYLCAYGIQPVMQIAAVKAIFGEAAFRGRLPVTIPGMYKRGEGIVER